MFLPITLRIPAKSDGRSLWKSWKNKNKKHNILKVLIDFT